MEDVLALILAGGRGERLSVFTEERAKPAVTFAGKYRIIDFTLSNCVNSGISKVGVLTQYRPRSLHEHIGSGRPWDLDRSRGGVAILQPYEARSSYEWYKGTADAVYQNLYFIEEQRAKEILILAGDHIYKMHYDEMIAFHQAKEADVTVGVSTVPIEDASRFGIMTLDEDDAVIAFDEKPPRPKSNIVSMGIYMFNREILFSALEDDVRHRDSAHDFGRDVVPRLVKTKRVYGYRFAGYWRDVGTVESYWRANMDLLDSNKGLDVYDPEYVVHTKSSERPPAKFGAAARVSDSLVSHGCIIHGEVRHSVLSPGVVVHKGAVVVDSIIFDNSVLGSNTVVNKCILDKEVWVGAGSYLGFGDDYRANFEEPEYLCSGITVVGKRARIPAGTKIGRNCKVNPSVRETDFVGEVVPSGGTVAKRLTIVERVGS